jgi:AraC-like DNA-binding protein
MIDDLSHFFIFFAGFMSWTVALGVVLENHKTAYHYLFAGMMFCLGTLQLLDGLLVAGKLGQYSFLIFWYLPFMALLGPLFFFSFKSANNDSFRFRPADYLHFFVAMLSIPFLVPLSTLDAQTKMSYILLIPDLSGSDHLFKLYAGLLAAAILNIMGYQLYFMQEYAPMLNFKLIRAHKASPYLMAVLLINFPLEVIFFGSLIVLSMVSHPNQLFFGVVQSLTALSFLLTLVVFIMEKKNINFFKMLNLEIESRRTEASKTQNLDMASILPRITALMEEEKIFCDEDLSLNGMAREIGVEPYQLSRIINEKFNKNFKSFVNEYRIEEAKKILLNDRGRTIISVAYAVGFNSTTVFYEWFKRLTGSSPKQYRAMNKNPRPVSLDTVISS